MCFTFIPPGSIISSLQKVKGEVKESFLRHFIIVFQKKSRFPPIHAVFMAPFDELIHF